MLDPNIQQINNIPQTDDTSDIAGGSAVTPSYITSDVPDYTEVGGSAGIDSVEVSTGVSTQTVDISVTPETEESANYIKADVQPDITVADLLDGYEMNSLDEIENASKYIDPEDAAVQALLRNLKDWGIINSDMSQDDAAYAIHGYVISTFSYKPDVSGDVWFSPSQTLANGGGDCEDLANLTASLITAALMDRGLSLEDASKRAGCVVIGDINYGTGHVYVCYAGEDGSVMYLDSVSSRVMGEMASSKILLFSYNAGSVDVINNTYDYSMLNTAADDPNLIRIPQDTSTYIKITDFEGYWLSQLQMKAGAPALISALQSFINTYGSYGSTFGCTAELTTISNFLSALQGSCVQDSATVAAFRQMLTNLDTALTTYINQRPEINISDALAAWRLTDLGSGLYSIMPVGQPASPGAVTVNGEKYYGVSAEWIHNKIEAGYNVTMSDTLWGRYNQRHQAVNNTVQYASAADAKALSDFEIAQTNLFKAELADTIADNAYAAANTAYTNNDLGWAMASKAWTLPEINANASAEWICSKESDGWGVTGNVGTARDRKAARESAATAKTTAHNNLGPAQTAFSTATTAYDTAYNALFNRCSLVRTAQNMDNDVKALKNSSTLTNYYNYSVKYTNSFTTTTNYIEAITSTMKMGEDRLESIGDTLSELNKVAALLDYQAQTPNLQQTVTNLNDELTAYNADTSDMKITRSVSSTHPNCPYNDASMYAVSAADSGGHYHYLYCTQSELNSLIDCIEHGKKWNGTYYIYVKYADTASVYRYQQLPSLISTAQTNLTNKMNDYIDTAVTDGYITSTYGNTLKGQSVKDALANLNPIVNNHTMTITTASGYDLVTKNNDGTYSVAQHMDSMSSLTVAQLQSQFFTQDPTTKYWSLRTDLLTPNPLNPDGSPNPNYYNLLNSLNLEINAIKGVVMIMALVHEAKRDLWGLVNKELQGTEEAGYKGMDISKLFARIIQRTVSAFYTFMQGLVNVVNVMNQTEYNDKVDEVNETYDQRSQDIKDKGDSLDDIFKTWDEYWKQDEYQTQNQKERVEALKARAEDYKAVITNNLTVFAGILESMGMATGNDAINDAIQKILSGEIEIYTPDTTDDPWYKQVDYDQVGSLREQIVGAAQNLRMQLMAAETMTGMRNLVHQEMTGISGRTMRTDVTSEMVETEQNAVLTWFDKTVEMADTKVQLDKQIRYYEINIDKLNEQLKEIKQWYNQVMNVLAKVVVIVFTVVGAIVGGIPGAAIGGIIGSMVGSFFSAVRGFVMGTKFLEIEKSHNDVIKPKEYHYTPTNPTTVHLSNGTNPEDQALNVAGDADNQVDEELKNMDSENYLKTLDDGHNSENSGGETAAIGAIDGFRIGGGIGALVGAGLGYLLSDSGDFSFSGSSVFDTAKFAAAYEKINNLQALIMVVNGIRRDTAQLRDLVHMEMTGIGGRTSSNMLTYAMEAARGQMASVANLSRMSLQDQNQSRNMEYQRNRNLLKAIQNIANSVENIGLSIIPVIGESLANQNDMYTAKDNYTEEGRAKFETDARFENDALNGLLDNGLVDTGDGKLGVNYNKISQVRADITRQTIANAVKAAVAKAASDMRSLVHMEMTGVRSSTSDIASEVNTVQFQAAMETLSLITEYLGEKASVANKALDAQRMAAKLQDQINTNWASMVITAALEVLAYATQLGWLSVIANIGSSLFNTLNAYYDLDYARNRANDDTGQLEALLSARKVMKDSVNSTDSRLEELEQQCLDEITAELLQNTGFGTVGVNKGIASRYKNALEKAARRDKTIKAVKDALQELRNTVNEMLTGVSGITSHATETAVSVKLQQAKANIDDAFGQLEEIADRKNEITDAERDLSRAQVKMTMALVSLAITAAVTSAVQIMKTNALKGVTDQAKIDGIKEHYDGISMDLTLLNLVVNLALNYYQRDQLTADENRIESRDITVNGKTVTSAQKSSKIQASEMQDASSFEDLAAVYEEKAGQSKIRSQALTNKFKMSQINNEFNENLVNWVNQSSVNAAGTLKRKQDIKNEKVSVNQRDEEASKVEGSKEIKVAAPADAKDAKKTASLVIKDLKQVVKAIGDAAKNLKEILKDKVKAADAEAVQKAVASLNAAVSQMVGATKESIKSPNFSKEVSNPNSSNTLAYADSILNAMTETAKTGGAQDASAGKAESEEKPTIEDLKKALEQAKQRLVEAQKELGKAMKELSAAKGSLPKAGQQVAAVKEAMDKEIKRLADEAKEIDGKTAEYDDLEKKTENKEAKKLIQGQKQSLRKQFDELKKEWEKAGITIAAAEVGEKEAKKHVSDATEKVVRAKEEKAGARQDMASLSKELNQLLANAKNGTVTPMYVTEKELKKIA